MGLQHQEYNARYLAAIVATGQPTNDAEKYGVRIVEAEVPEGETYWRVIGVHHLTPEENGSKHNAYLELLDEDGKRILEPRAWAGWTWKDRHPDEDARPVPFDKPLSEPASNIPIEKEQKISVWIAGFAANARDRSDQVVNLHTIHPDEPGPQGELWNSIGHHSFYVVFQRTRKGGTGPAIGAIDGRIANGRGYRVRLFRGPTLVSEQTVQADGAFRFDKLRPGVYRLEAVGPTLTRDQIELSAERPELTVDLAAPE